jgi:hypothetical protein
MLTEDVAAQQEYSPDEYLAVLGPLKALCGKIDHVRVVGSDTNSAHRLLALVGEGMTVKSVWQAVDSRSGAIRVVCPSDFYPNLPGQASFFDDGSIEDSSKGSFVRHPFAIKNSKLGFYMDEDMIEAARKEAAHSSMPSSVLEGPVSNQTKGMPGLTSGREKVESKEKAVETTVSETAPRWPEGSADTDTEIESSGGSSADKGPFSALADEDIRVALLAAVHASDAVQELVERCPSPEMQQREAAQEYLPDTNSSGDRRLMRRVTSGLQRKIKRFNVKAKDKTPEG